MKLAEHEREKLRREDELAEFSAHLNAASARWVELLWEFHETGWSDDPSGFLAYRVGITRREARELLRVGEALQQLPVIRAAFARGAVTLTKVRALTRVATPSCRAGAARARRALDRLAAAARATCFPAHPGRGRPRAA